MHDGYRLDGDTALTGEAAVAQRRRTPAVARASELAEAWE
jgi:hypothetical protein